MLAFFVPKFLWSLCIPIWVSLLLYGGMYTTSAQWLPSPWYLQDLKTSSIASSTTDILDTADNGTHLFVMTADDSMHLFSYSAGGGFANNLSLIGKYAISSSVQQGISSGLSWRTSSALTIEYNNYTNNMYAIKYTIGVFGNLLQVFVLNSSFNHISTLTYGGLLSLENFWDYNFQNP
ncbi:hypothetical protein BKA69DRAFT_819467 [Paraphysoderma sedebokerense]|nr:hypothetical protein BKA69DRAFT_819467 [Paraphysoderma sedebokerense]